MATSIKEITRGFSRDAVVQLSESRHEPEWLLDLRLEAWAEYEALPMPERTEEEWRRTDIRDLPLQAVQPFAAGRGRVASRDELPAAIRTELELAGALSGVVVQVDSSIIYHEVAPELAEQGVVFVDMDTAVRDFPELLQEFYMKAGRVESAHHKFSALHAAFWTTGSFLYVPDDVEVALPFQAYSSLETPALATFFHTLIAAGTNASVTFVDNCQSETLSEESFTDNVVEIHAGEGANLRYIQVQDWGRHVWNFHTQRGIINQDASVSTLNVSLGSLFSKNVIASTMAEAGASAEMLGLYFTDKDQFLDNHTHQDHVAPYATSDLLFKGAVKDHSRAVYSGTIRVSPGSHGTDSYQANRNLSLSPNARVDTMPNLEIGANDVRCTHGATISQIEEEYIFYLMSRGITRTEAEKLIVDGFFDEVIERVPVESVQRTVRAAIDRKIGYAV